MLSLTCVYQLKSSFKWEYVVDGMEVTVTEKVTFPVVISRKKAMKHI